GHAERGHWFAGLRRGRRVVLRANPHWGACSVEVDPPAWLGLRAAARGRLFGTQLDLRGYPADWFDRQTAGCAEADDLRSGLMPLPGTFDALASASLVEVGIGASQPVEEERWLEAVEHAFDLAARVDRLRQVLPTPPWRRAVTTAYSELAAT